MNRGIVVFIVVCGLAAAMVSRDTRAVNTEEETTTPIPKICEKQTPCAWSIYKLPSKIIEVTVGNSYCECESGTVCMTNEEDFSAGAYIHRCRLPSEANEWQAS